MRTLEGIDTWKRCVSIIPFQSLEDMRTLEGIDTFFTKPRIRNNFTWLEDMRTLEGIDTVLKKQLMM